MAKPRKSSSVPSKTILILSISSDIGRFLAEQYLSLGYLVIGTCRSLSSCRTLKKHPHCHIFVCDVHNRRSVDAFVKKVKSLGAWDSLISCVGYPLPVKPFFQADFEQWQDSVLVNSLDQLRLLHGLYPLRRKSRVCDVVFFAGGGVNNAVVNFSAYTIGKIVLTKMCEFLDAETPDLNIFIVGPGKTRTKIHQMILDSPGAAPAKIQETKEFLRQGQGTDLKDIFACIQWLCAEGRPVAGGRNFSVVYDAWRPPQQRRLAKALKADSNMYKLRRHRNDFTPAQ